MLSFGKINRAILYLFVALAAALCALTSSHPSPPFKDRTTAGSLQQPSADSWAKAVADTLTNPRFYAKFPKDLAQRHFGSIVKVPTWNEQSGVLEGRSPERGILYLYSNVRVDRKPPDLARVIDLQLVMPLTDSEGHEVFPILLGLLRQRLRPPVWVYEPDKLAPERHSWRRGASPYVIDLQKGDFSAAGFREAGTGPWVIAGAGEEQGWPE